MLLTFFLINSVQGQFDIYSASKNGDLELVKKLLTADSSLLNIRDSYGMTPLHYASAKSIEVVAYLVGKGADVNIPSNDETTPLYTAARFWQTKIVQYLLEHNANVNARSLGGAPIHQAAYRPSTDMVVIFLAYKADLSITDTFGQTPIHIAASYDADSVLIMLITAGGNINTKDKEGNTPLHSSLKFYDYDSTGISKSALILIKNSALLNQRNKEGLTPLGMAIRMEATNMIRVLTEAGAIK